MRQGLPALGKCRRRQRDLGAKRRFPSTLDGANLDAARLRWGKTMGQHRDISANTIYAGDDARWLQHTLRLFVLLFLRIFAYILSLLEGGISAIREQQDELGGPIATSS